MTAYASASYSLATPMPEIDTLAKLRGVLSPHADLPLVFEYAGKRIAPGYHVTEVKAASLSSLDCGANPENWNETIIQLWDVEQDGMTHMKTAKFLGILAQVGRRVAIDDDGLLIFECGDSLSPMQVFTVGAIYPKADLVTVELAPRPATCKPRDRGLEVVATKESCCAPKPAASSCCSSSQPAKSSCCG